jgi:hypothetical protein
MLILSKCRAVHRALASWRLNPRVAALHRPSPFHFAADGHAGKFLEPWAFRHFGFGAEPIRHQPKLIGGNVAAADAVKQMIEEVWRQIVAPDSRHGYSP